MKISVARMSQRLVTLLFPPKCVGCRELLPPSAGERDIFCPLCQAAWESGRLSADAQLVRPLVGDAEKDAEGDVVLVSVARYRSGRTDGIPERLIYHIKHRDERRVFTYAARQLLVPLRRALSDTGEGQKIGSQEILISYPPRRPEAVRKDGFDQAKRLGQALSRLTGWPLRTLLERTEAAAREQKRLGAEDRLKNAASAYELSPNASLAQGKTVILLDDLYTTGATLHTCARLLLSAGATRVILATVGRTCGED